MVASMTGFSCSTHEASWGTLVWEIRSVNHRFLEMSLRLPESLRAHEMTVRERIQAAIKRGKVDASLRFIPGAEVPFEFVVNEPLLQQLAKASNQINPLFANTVINPLEILNWQGILETRPTHLKSVMAAMLSSLDQALSDLVIVRNREGQGVKLFIENRLKDVNACVEKITKLLPKLKEQTCEKIKARFNELALEVNPERLEQEMVWLLQKMDIAEEIQRLYSHLKEVKRALNQEIVGRRLDFLMQELNRETNTLGSKSVDSEVTQWVIEMKVQIEQMREQVQNIE
ncbi:MAG: YicC family protein [Coxiella sp. RIFCSPHIGHO2_12_FULL_42_15]|nr:MAG: YicC family protein [Coxiella sp. RIFCSPHIGHO2_12_FULL_42_15]